MNNLKIALLLCLISFHSACGGVEQDQTDVSDNFPLLLFDVTLDSGLHVENIGYKQRKIINDWVLQFRDTNNIQAEDAEGQVYPQKSISSADFLLLIDKSMQKISQREDYIPPSEIQVEFKFINEVKKDITSAIKEVAKNKDGVVELKDKDIFFAVLHALQESEQINQVCEILKKWSLSCEDSAIDLGQIAYRKNILGEEWESLLLLDDAGLVDGLWFSVSIEKEPR